MQSEAITLNNASRKNIITDNKFKGIFEQIKRIIRLLFHCKCPWMAPVASPGGGAQNYVKTRCYQIHTIIKDKATSNRFRSHKKLAFPRLELETLTRRLNVEYCMPPSAGSLWHTLFHTTVSAGLTHKRTKRPLRAPSCKGAPSKTCRKLIK